MLTIILTILIGFIFGGLVTLIMNRLTLKDNPFLFGINLVFGALGAVSANQLLSYGPIFFDISIVPSIVGAVVLSLVSTYGYLYTVRHIKKLRSNS
jgi:uncharacterized membrane protein YeaQ/YmgE (transglycosylase-associated protein family)